MTTGARGLGRVFNASVGAVPTDAVAAAITGNRIHMRNCDTVAFLVVAAAGSTDILDLDLQEHDAATGGNSQDLDIITKYYYQDETTLDGDETWTEGSQSAASEITNVGSASAQQLVVVEVSAAQLSDGFEWVSLNVPDLGTNGTKYVAIINLALDLHVQRKPTNLANLNV